MSVLEDGRYTVVYPSGDYRTLRVKTPADGTFAGKTIVSYKSGDEYVGFGFLNGDNEVGFWKRFRENQPKERLTRISRALESIARDPEKAGILYATKEGRCRRCGKQLTVPASLHRGMGPECAAKTVTKEDNRKAYDWLKQGGRQ